MESLTKNNMTEKEWLEKAIIFDLGFNTKLQRPVKIEARKQMDDSIFWVVAIDGTWVLGKDNELHFEPRPSSRTDEFIELTRFSSKEEAYQNWIKLTKTND